MLKEVLTGLTHLVYPPHCLICRKHLNSFFPDDILCPLCLGTISANIPPFCPKCSRHLANADRPRCHPCANNPPLFDFCWSACLYQPPLRDLIVQFKYHEKTRLRHIFGYLIAEFIRLYRFDIRQFDAMVPIPLHPARLRERGYNQSQLLAEKIARDFPIPLSLNNLIRVRHTEHQTLLSEKERWTNVHGAFRIKNSGVFSDKNVLIIDDLLTTGATACEVTRVLKRAGANTVGVLTLAITE